ncbi:uncharacterized protein LOC111638434 [Centruroides sculpturatus]|uniref:uncharacterized protein LOC111638434 n=1 Tax=Centruroides sculpturatus TaxID=218467 RepID=UPI000C6C8E76|nr:uncharacterized protein LOC111638434 [Centruroides sculpturatus]
MLLTSVLFILVSVFVAYITSRLIAKLYGNFEGINVFSSVECSLQDKLKMLNFMKRFGRRPIGLSIGGFFYVKKQFVIRILSAFYSALSGFLQLGSKSPRKNCGTKLLANNTLNSIYEHFLFK